MGHHVHKTAGSYATVFLYQHQRLSITIVRRLNAVAFRGCFYTADLESLPFPILVLSFDFAFGNEVPRVKKKTITKYYGERCFA